MPQVPQYQPQVSPQGAPSVRMGPAASPESYGAGIGDTLQRAGAQLYQQELYHQDRAAVLDAETKANAVQLQIQDQMANLRGKDAAKSVDFALGEFDKAHADIMSGLTSDRQRYYYGQAAARTREALNRSALSHFHRENEAFQENTFQGFMNESLNVARANYQDPMTVAFQRMQREGAIKDRAQRLGYSGTPQEANELVSANSMIHKEVIGAMLANGQDEAAAQYYAKVKNKEANGYVIGGETVKPGMQLTAQDRDVLDKAIEEGTTRGTSRTQASAIVAEHGIDTPQQRRNALKAADAIADPKISDLTRQRIEHQIAVEDKRKSEEYEQNFMGAVNTIEQKAKQFPKALPQDLIGATTWTSLKPEARHALELHAARLRNPGEAPHDPGVWFNFKTMPDNKLAQLTPSQLMSQYLVHFDKEHYDRALNEYNAAINVKEPKGKTTEEKFLSGLGTRDMIKNAFELSGIAKNPKKLTPEEAVWFNLWENEADRIVTKLPKDTPHDKIQKELSALSDRLLKQKFKVDPGTFSFNKTVPAIALPSTEGTVSVPLDTIPKDQQDLMRGLILDKGGKVSTGKLERIYAVKIRPDLSREQKAALIQQIVGE